LRLQYRMTFRDLAVFNFHYCFHNKTMVALFGVLLFFSVKKQVALFHGPMSFGPMAIVLTAATLIWGGLIALMFVLGLLVCLVPSHLKNTLTEHLVEVTEEGVVDVTPQTRLETRWAGIHRLGVMRRYLFLYVGPGNGHLIPRRAAIDEAAWQGVVAQCRKRYRESRTEIR
jgi:hypothetical protein